MKELRLTYLKIACALERRWTARKDKKIAAVFIRNAANETPGCYFCGLPAKVFDGELHDSPIYPAVSICRYCVSNIARTFGLPTHRQPTLASIKYTVSE